jgi:hypothetical protein
MGTARVLAAFALPSPRLATMRSRGGTLPEMSFFSAGTAFADHDAPARLPREAPERRPQHGGATVAPQTPFLTIPHCPRCGPRGLYSSSVRSVPCHCAPLGLAAGSRLGPSACGRKAHARPGFGAWVRAFPPYYTAFRTWRLQQTDSTMRHSDNPRISDVSERSYVADDEGGGLVARAQTGELCLLLPFNMSWTRRA